MFKKDDKSLDNELILSLKNRISELESQLIQVAQSNGNIILKELPNGKLEMNGIPFNNDSTIEYYNSSQATFGELTMYRVGKEFMQREMNKLIQTHMSEIDEYKRQISNLQQDILMLEGKSKIDNDTIKMHEEREQKLLSEVSTLKSQNENDKETAIIEKENLIQRYEGMIAGLEEDIKSWKERYLKINNITLDGTIITKYGKVLGN